MLEGISLNNKPFTHGPVINGPEVTHIIRTGIRTDTGSFEPAFIGYHLIGIDLSPIAIEELMAELAIPFTERKLEKLTHYHHPQIDLFVGDFF
jgi:hypothetical protein